MAWTNLKAAIAAVVRTNNNQEITGANLQNVLNAIANNIGANATYAGIATTSTNPGTPDGPVFYFALQGGAYSNFGGAVVPEGLSVLLWNGSSWASTSIFDKEAMREVYDISAANSGATYADLAEALGTDGANVPEGIRNGGMSIKFVQNSDNKYVQYRLMSDTFNTTPANWQGVDDEPTAGSNNLVKSSGVYDKTRYHFTPIWRDGRKLYYDNIERKLKITGNKTAPAEDHKLCIFCYKGVNYTITDTVSEKSISWVRSGNAGFFIPVSGSDTSYTLDNIVKFEDNIEHSGYIKIAHITYRNEVMSDVIFNLRNMKDFSVVNGSEVDNIHARGIYRFTSNNNEIALFVSVDGNNQTRLWQDSGTGFFHVESRKYIDGVWTDWINTNEREFTETSTNDIDAILDTGVYAIKTVTNRYILFVHRDVDTNNVSQTRVYTYLGVGTTIENRFYDVQTETWSSWENYLESSVNLNPILKNHCDEIRWRGTARLYWDSTTKTIYWSDGVTSDSNSIMLNLNYNGKTIKVSSSVKSRVFNTVENAQLLLPLPASGENNPLTLNDIVIQADNLPYDKIQYVKIAHLTYGNAISSFIIDSSQLDQKFDLVMERENIDNAALNPDFNYNNFVIIDGSILNTGILETYRVPGERAAFFFKMPENKRPPVISGCTILAYQWYSDFPDYIYGTNSLGRTLTNTPPENAKYCGITLHTIYDYSNITVRPLFYDRNKIGLYGSYLNNSIGENCFANGVRTNLKIIGYGNSFMRNSVHYLSAIAKGCGVNLTVGNLYTGGTQLADHYNALLNNTSPYEWHKYVDGQNTVNQYNQRALRGLLDERWDAIILHQYTPWDNPFEPIFNRFIKLIIEKLGYCPKIYINATWAGSLDNNQTYYGFVTEEEMWQAMLDNVKQACKDSGIAEFSIIPTGTAIQNARTLSYADDYIRFCNGSDDLHHLNPAGGFIAACTIFEKIVTPLNGIHCSDTTFRITSSTNLPPQSAVQQGILVTNDNYLSMCQAAIEAVNNPDVVTTIPES